MSGTDAPRGAEPAGGGESDGAQRGERYDGRDPQRDARTGRTAASERIRNQTRWVDLQVQQAIERGEFDDLPGTGKPLDLPDRHDPDWWVKRLIEREQITGIAPAAISLRSEDAGLDAVLDREATPEGVRRVVEDFNARVVAARRQLTGGPPVVTPTRDVAAEVEAWAARRTARREAARRRDAGAEERPTARRHWWQRRS